MKKQVFLAMSLQYGLKVLTFSRCALNGIAEISAVGTEEYQILGRGFQYGWYGDIYDCKPILRHPSDLVKEIEQANYNNGNPFIPIKEIQKRNDFIHILNGGFVIGAQSVCELDELPTWVTQLLIEWHFNLMDEGEEFVDVNTLETNPYK